MAEFLLPASLAADLATINTRLNDLETSARVDAAAIRRNLDTVTATAIAAIAAANLTTADIAAKLTAAAVADVGMGRTKAATCLGAYVAAYNIWEYGTGASWTDLDGNTGIGYGQVTVTTGSKVIAIVTAQISHVAFDLGPTRSQQVYFGVGIDGADPGSGTQLFRPVLRENGGPIEIIPVTAVFMASNFVPGSHVFRLGAKWADNNPAGAVPAMHNSSLIVIPLN